MDGLLGSASQWCGGKSKDWPFFFGRGGGSTAQVNYLSTPPPLFPSAANSLFVGQVTRLRGSYNAFFLDWTRVYFHSPAASKNQVFCSFRTFLSLYSNSLET